MWLFAVVAGLVAAVVDTAVMIPLEFPTGAEKREAMTAAFVERFVLGFVIGPVAAGLDVNGVAIGATLGLAASLGPAIITKTWAPILAMGLVTGLGVGIAYQLVY
jgi:hypothetical protein